jgi:hypothetical protein
VRRYECFQDGQDGLRVSSAARLAGSVKMDLFEQEPPSSSSYKHTTLVDKVSDVPADIRLIASTSRLLDFHQSRSSGTHVFQPEVPDSAASNLFLATTLLKVLGELELEQGQVSISVKRLLREVNLDTAITNESALEHCILSLSRPREIRYGVRTEAGVAHARTSDSTPLLTYDQSLRQVGLTENARLLIRVSELKDSWLYSDVDAQRLLMALERKQFSDIPRFCREILRDLANKARQLADVAERPAYSDLREALIEQGAAISDALREAGTLVHQAMELLFSAPVASAFELWKASSNVAYELGNLQAELENVLHVTELLSRKFVNFVIEAQNAQTVRAPTMGFLDLVQSLHTRQAGFAEQLEVATLDMVPWFCETRFFSPDLLAGEISLSRLYALSLPAPIEITFEHSDELVDQEARAHAFLERNADVILGALSLGPRTLSDLMGLEGLHFEGDEDISAFVGAYSYPEIFDVNDQRVCIMHHSDFAELSTEHSTLVTSDPIVFIAEVANDAL